MVLLDTNVVSELLRADPAPAVQAHLRRHESERIFTAAICLAEVRYGLARLPVGRRRDRLAASVEAFLTGGFDGRILPFDAACAGLYGVIRAERGARGRPIEVADAMIAATARAHGATLITRNVDHFADCGIAAINPSLGPRRLTRRPGLGVRYATRSRRFARDAAPGIVSRPFG